MNESQESDKKVGIDSVEEYTATNEVEKAETVDEGAVKEEQAQDSSQAPIEPAAPTPELAVTPPAPGPQAQALREESRVESQYAKSLRGIVLKVLLGATIATAAVTVILILIGSWNDATWRALWTIVVALIHLVFVLSMVSSSVYARNERSVRSGNAVINTALVLTAISFFVAILGIWKVFSGEVVGDFYVSFIVVFVASLHAKVLYDAAPTAVNAKVLIAVNYGVITFLSTLIILWAFMPGLNDILGGFYGRLIAATVVVNVTLTNVIAVMRRLYMQSHPEARQARSGMSGGMIALLVFVAILAVYVLPLFALMSL